SASSQTSRSSLSATPASAASTPSSPSLRAQAAGPCSSRAATYEPCGRSRARADTRRHSQGAKHDREPVWQAGPAGRTRSRIASPSQSSRSSSTARVEPDVSPLCQSSARLRLQNHASPVSRVSCSARSSIQASMSTRPSSASWTIAARSAPSGPAPRPHRPSARLELATQLRQPLGILVHDRGDERRLRPGLERLREMARAAGATGGDDGNLDGVRDRPGQLQVVARPRPVRVDRRDQKLARAARDRLLRPLDGVDSARPRARVGDDLTPAYVDRAHDRLRAERLGEAAEEARLVERGPVHGHLVGARAQEREAVLRRAHASPDRERDLELGRGALDELQQRPAALERGGDVEEDELVRAEPRVAGGELDRVAHVAQVLEANTLDDATAGHVEARDQPLLDHRSAFASSTAPAAPLRSGWNWTPARAPCSTAATISPSWSTVAATSSGEHGQAA